MMMRVILVVIILILVATLWLPLQAEEKGFTAEVMGRLQEVIENQRTMLQKLEGIEKELQIIKVRASR